MKIVNHINKPSLFAVMMAIITVWVGIPTVSATSKIVSSNSDPSSAQVTMNNTYTVISGDSLWKIAQIEGVSEARLIQANHLTNPNALSVGEVLDVTSATSSAPLPKQTEVHSITALQQRLAGLGYLPFTDTLQWKYADVPPSLKLLWHPGLDNVMTLSAVMAFQFDNGLTTDGIAGPRTWAAIDTSIASKKDNPHGYSYAYVSDTAPFTLYLWNDGNYVLTSLVNLGITQSQTVIGTYPVYLQYQTQEMTGENPDGTKYDDPGVPYVSYFYRGEAIHGFPRVAYGSQQSLGCAELPDVQAQEAWNYIHIGTLVTIDK